MTISSKTFLTESEGIKRIGYVRLSRDDAKSMSVENQMKALAEYDPAMQIVVDKGVSGETNITDPRTAWNRELMPALQAHPDTQLVVYTLDRVGRKKGKVMSAIEDLIDNGGTLFVLRDKKLYNDPENFERAEQLAQPGGRELQSRGHSQDATGHRCTQAGWGQARSATSSQ